MMKKALLFLFTVVAYSLMTSQVWHEKAQLFQLGVGESYTFKTRIKENEKNYTSKSTGSRGNITAKSTPAFFLKFETAVNKYIGVGVSVGYRKTEITQIIPYSYYDTTVAYPFVFGGYYYPQRTAHDIFTFKINDLSIGARVNYHFLPDKKVDPYIGVAAGYRLFNRDYSYTTDNPHGVYYVVEYENILPVYASATLGVRYLFANDLGVYAEVGIDKWSVIQGGIILKLQ